MYVEGARTLQQHSDLTYDSYGNLTSRKDYIFEPGGSVNTNDYVRTDYVYNTGAHSGMSAGSVVMETRRYTSANEYISDSYTYDAYGRVLSRANAADDAESFTYDAVGRVLTHTNFDGTSSSNVYDDAQNTLTATNEGGYSTRYSYDAFGNISSVMDMERGETLLELTYDNLLRISTSNAIQSDGSGSKTDYTYDALNRATSAKTYDASGALLKHEITEYTDYIASFTRLVTKTVVGSAAENAPSIITKTYIDGAGKTLREGGVIGGQELMTEYSYDAKGNVIQTKDAAGNISTAEYGYFGQTSATDPAGAAAYMTYNSLGLQIESKSPAPNDSGNLLSTTTRYDLLGRVLQVETPSIEQNGTAYTAKSLYEYDVLGNVTLQKIQNNAPGESISYSETAYEYDDMSRLLGVVSYNGSAIDSAVKYAYDALGNKLSMTTGLSLLTANDGVTTLYEYDHLGQLTELIYPVGMSESYEYDLSGNLTSKTDRNGNATENSYDGLNRLVDVHVKLSDNSYAPEFLTTGHNLNGTKASEENETLEVSFEYDALGRMTKQTEVPSASANSGSGAEVVKQYGYNSLGLTESFALSIDGGSAGVTEYEYDNCGRLVIVYFGDVIQAQYSYYPNGARKQLVEGGSAGSGNAIVTDYVFEPSGALRQLMNRLGSSGGELLSSYTYTHSVNGLQLTKTDHEGVTTAYTYDGLGRLLTETTSDGETDIGYTYDRRGNRAAMTNSNDSTVYTYDANNRLTETIKNGSVVTIFTYDDNGNLLREQSDGAPMTAYLQGFSGDPDRKLTVNRYDGFNRLAASNTGKGNAYFAYRPDGLRHAKQTDSSMTVHIWNGQNMAAELGADGELVATYIRGVNLIAAADESGTNSESELTYYLYNGHGDVVQLVCNGDVVKEYEYDAFGVETDIDDNDTNPFRYCAEYYDHETNTYYLRARNYNPEMSRFFAEDPIREGLNWYSYCYNDPITFIDPSGCIPTAEEAASMAQHVYDPVDGDFILLGGWYLVEIYVNDESLSLGIYARELNGSIEYALVSKGTGSWSLFDSDLWNNLGQPLGLSKDVKDSIAYATDFVGAHKESEVTMVGHSKGGAEAVINAIAADTNCITFNSMTPNLNAYSIETPEGVRIKLSEKAKSHLGSLTHYVVKGDPLNSIFGEVPVGETRYLSATTHGSPHAMSTVIVKLMQAKIAMA